MRLIDADLQYDRLADELEWLMQYGDDVYLAVAEALRKEPTAYDVDKVVEELDEYIAKIVGRKSALYQTIMKIVKRGGKHDI